MISSMLIHQFLTLIDNLFNKVSLPFLTEGSEQAASRFLGFSWILQDTFILSVIQWQIVDFMGLNLSYQSGLIKPPWDQIRQHFLQEIQLWNTNVFFKKYLIWKASQNVEYYLRNCCLRSNLVIPSDLFGTVMTNP